MANRKKKSPVSSTSRKRNNPTKRRLVPLVTEENKISKVKPPRHSIKGGHGVFLTGSADETRELGAAFSRLMKKGNVVFLSGDLGCGKTTFVQGIARGFGIDDVVRSSSFILVNEYRSPRVKMYHIDLYRLEGENIDDFGLEEYIYGDGICVIEWASKIRRFPVASAWEVTLTWISESQRKIEFHKTDQKCRCSPPISLVL